MAAVVTAYPANASVSHYIVRASPSAEVKNRRVVRAVLDYGVVAFALLQVIEPIMHGLHLPEARLTWALAAMAVAFPVVVAVAFLNVAQVGRSRDPRARGAGDRRRTPRYE